MLAPGTGTGLTATYFTAPGFGGFSLTPGKPDPFIDINTGVSPPSQPKMDLPLGFGPSYSAVWEGEVVPSFTEPHNFYVAGSGATTLYINGAAVTFPPPPASSAPGGCGHDLCSLGDKLDPTCNSCVHDICQVDPYCCNGGYLSYYSLEPVWDARCIAEVATYCAPAKCTTPLPTPGSPHKKSDPVALQAGVHYTIRVEYSNPTTDKTMSLMWSSARVAKQVIPQFALYPKAMSPVGLGTGLNVTLFANKVSATEALVPDLDTVVAAGSVVDLSLAPPLGPSGTPIVDLLASRSDTTAGRPLPPILVRPRYGDEVFVGGSGQIKVRGVGGITGGWIHLTVEGGGADMLVPVSADGEWDAAVPIATGPQKLKLVQQTFPGGSCTAARVLRRERPVVLAADGHAGDGVAQGADHPLADRSRARSVAQRRPVHGRRPRNVGHGARRRSGRAGRRPRTSAELRRQRKTARSRSRSSCRTAPAIRTRAGTS